MSLRSAIGWLAGRLVLRAVRHMQPRVIYDVLGETAYLSRYYLVGAPSMADGSSPFDAHGEAKPDIRWSKLPFGLYVHRFHRSDADVELHSHPWSWSLSFVIAGGYREERREEEIVVTRDVKPLSFNFIGGDNFHRVDLLESEAVSLFLVGPKVSTWGFWNRRTKAFMPWREFLNAKRAARRARCVDITEWAWSSENKEWVRR